MEKEGEGMMDYFEKNINASDLIDWIMCAFPDWCVGDVRKIVDHVNEMPSAQPEPCNNHENDKVIVDKDAYEQCRFEYINACKITHNRTPDTRQSDINDAYAVIKALQPIFGEESF